MYKKIRFLENKSANILIRNVSVGENIKEENRSRKWFLKSKYKLPKEIGPLDTCFADFLKLGKELYEVNKSKINKIDFKKVSFKLSNKIKTDIVCDARIGYLLINSQNEYNEETKKILYNYCNGKGNSRDKYNETNLLYLVENNDYPLFPIETDSLLDISIFTYLVICSLRNYYKGEYKNDISFETFTNIDKNNIADFLDAIIFFMKTYEPSSYSPPLLEHTELKYNPNDQKVETYRTFDSIFSLYWFILKLQIMAISNNTTLINLCGCGEVILGKGDFCKICTLAHRAENKRKQRTPPNKKKKVKS